MGSTELLLCFLVITTRIRAAAGQEAEPLFAALAKAARQRLSEFNPQELANIVWALATGSQWDEALGEAVTMAAVPHLGEFNP